MERAIMYAALLTLAVSYSPIDAHAQQSPAEIASTARPPETEAWTDRRRPFADSPFTQCANAPTVEVPDKAPTVVGGENPGVVAIEKDDDGELQQVMEETFLLPVLHRGFWAMPPGGFTRILIQPPIPINPDAT
jgi:hypothetical protein